MFTNIVYINLKRRRDRQEHMLRQLRQLKWKGDVECIDAIDGQTIHLPDIAHLITTKAYHQALTENEHDSIRIGKYMTTGAIGCALSHRQAWIRIRNSHHQKTLVLEDDIVLDNSFDKKLHKYLTRVPVYDLLYIGYHDNHIIDRNMYNEYYKIPCRPVYGLFAYIVDKRCIDTLLGLFPITTQLDTEIARVYPLLNVFYLTEHKRLVHTIPSFGTDIQEIRRFSFPFRYILFFLGFVFVLCRLL